MATLAEFLELLFGEGRVVFREPPGPVDRESKEDRKAAGELLRRAFDEEIMELAGPPLAFEERVAIDAARWTRLACWFLVSRGDAPEVVEQALALPKTPGSAASHLSADLTFRFLPGVHRRARAIDSDDVVSLGLGALLRAWPLSGAGADLEEGPTTPTDFDGHDGLLLRFAERLAEHPRASWTPQAGRSAEWWAIALDALGRRHEREHQSEADAEPIGGAPRGRA